MIWDKKDIRHAGEIKQLLEKEKSDLTSSENIPGGKAPERRTSCLLRTNDRGAWVA